MNRSQRRSRSGYQPVPAAHHCDCEHVACEDHVAGACVYPAFDRVVTYGEAQWLCNSCAETAARARLASNGRL